VTHAARAASDSRHVCRASRRTGTSGGPTWCLSVGLAPQLGPGLSTGSPYTHIRRRIILCCITWVARIVRVALGRRLWRRAHSSTEGNRRTSAGSNLRKGRHSREGERGNRDSLPAMQYPQPRTSLPKGAKECPLTQVSPGGTLTSSVGVLVPLRLLSCRAAGVIEHGAAPGGALRRDGVDGGPHGRHPGCSEGRPRSPASPAVRMPGPANVDQSTESKSGSR